MDLVPVCPKCRLPLPENAAEGLCPRCLLEAGLQDTVTAETRASEHTPAPLPDFGPYHTIGVLGEGGMGIVYLAEQRQPVRRRVALKVLKHADSGSSVVARFQSESQALALMDHPNIAQVYDAGTTAGGLPYIAMEYVPGIPITDYCDRNLLGFRDRLALFQQVCQAVHHAHQKGVIHRDLKPSNVLVMVQDGKPVPKVIDFGVAKAVNQRLVERTLFTEIGMLIGTPEYMSPEQADLSGLDVDSATDIYSLGVLLYELLVGALPYDSATLRRAGYGEIQRMIREEDPPRPSTRLSSLGATAHEVARQRRSDVRTLTRLLRDDLEWITMKALEKDRTRRYASASEFAADIARHMGNEPVMAGPPGIVYRGRKFVRRHRGLVGAGATVAVALLIGAVVSFSLYLRSERERERAEFESYAANLSTSELQLEAGQVADARSRLASASPAFQGWEWRHLMARADESESTIYFRDFAGADIHVRCREIDFSQDGAQVFSYGDTFLRSWDIASKRRVTDLSGLGRVLAVGAYGKTVLTGPPLQGFADPPAEGFVVRLYDVGTRREMSVLRGMTVDPGNSAISADGAWVAVAQDHYGGVGKVQPTSVMVWDARTGRVAARLEGHPDWVTNLSFSPDGGLLASASLDKTVQLWSLPTGRKGVTLPHDAQVYGLAFSNDGRQLASVSIDGKVRIWNPATGLLLRSWNASLSAAIIAIAFSPDASMIAAGSPGTVRVWDVATGRLRRDFHGGLGVVYALAFHPKLPRLYSGYIDAIKEWDLDRRDGVLDDVTKAVRAVAVSPDGRYIASGSGGGFARSGTVRVYDGASGNLLRSMAGHAGDVTALAFSPDSALVASASFDKTIKLWNASDGTLARTLTGHTDSVFSIAFTPDGRRLISGSEDQTVRVWDLPSDGPPATISTTSPIARVAVSPDGRTILAMRSWDKSISLWDMETKRRSGALSTGTLDLVPSQLRSMALSRDGEVLIGPAEEGQAIAVWDFTKQRLRQILPVFHGDDHISSLAISPDGTRLAVGESYSGNLSVWDLRRGKRLVTLDGHKGGVSSLAWTPDGTRLISSSSSDRTVRVWDSRSPYNNEAELWLDSLSERCLLAEEMVQELNADRMVSAGLRKDAIQLAWQRGNADYDTLTEKGWQTGATSGRPGTEYTQALRRTTLAAQAAPWYGRAHLTLGLLQYRTGAWQQALASAQRAIEILKATAPDAHAIRAMAYFRLHDGAQAKNEVSLGRQAASKEQPPQDHKLLDEAESLVSGARSSK